MSSSFNLLSRPNQTLYDHLNGVGEKCSKIAKDRCLKPPMENIAYLIGISHDFGKGTNFFQKYITSPEEYGRTRKKNHGSLSAYFCYHLLSKYADISNERRIPLIGWYVVQRHHGNLTDFSTDPEKGELKRKTTKSHINLLKEQMRNLRDNNIEELKKIYEKLDVDADIEAFIYKMKTGTIFRQLRIDFLKEEMDLGGTLDLYYTILFLYSALLDADKLDAANLNIPTRNTLPHNMVDRYKREVFGKPERQIDKIREAAAESVNTALAISNLNEHFYSITLPTGAGKTLIALNSALELRKRISKRWGFKPRIIYSLPFLAIIEQNYEVLKQVLEYSSCRVSPDILLKHHYLSTGYMENGKTTENAAQALLLTEGWHSEVVVTTFIQFFESLITNRNSRARKVHNMANSIIVLDEVQAIPRKYWKLIKKALIILGRTYNSYVILMTATNPLIFETQKEIRELVEDKERYYKELDRVDYNFDLEEKTLENAEREIIETFHRNPECDVMVVLNTINSSKQLYNKLKNVLKNHDNHLECIYLSTHLLPSDRSERIKRMKNKNTRQLIVTTQLIEAGVDIDVDIVFRDFAPLDSIIQTAGRCNRESRERRGKVNVIKLKDEETGRTFCSYIYDKILLEITEKIVEDLEARSESRFNLQAANEYFKLCRERGADEKTILENVENLRLSEISKFRLIEEDVKTVSIFIERNDEAEKVRKEVEEIFKEKHGYKLRASILPLKERFYKYIINIRVPRKHEEMLSYLQRFNDLEEMFLVQRKDVSKWYDDETGFKFPQDTFDFRLI